MNNRTCYLLVIILFLFCVPAYLSAQNITDFNNSYYANAVDLFEKELYTDADAQFRKAAEITDPTDAILLSNIASYRALCAINMQQLNSESIVIKLGQSSFADNPRINDIHFALAKQFYNAENYKKAIEWFEKTDNRELVPSDRIECLFMQGYSYFKAEEYDKALDKFVHVKIMPVNKYTTPATYYYAHIEYLKKNYLTALNAFNEIRHDERFSALTAIYALQIYAYQEQYQKVIDEGTKLLDLDSIPLSRYAETAFMVMDACYKMQQYEKAFHYFELYKEHVLLLTRDDMYIEASLYYYLGKYTEANNNFKKTLQNNSEDSLAQRIYYYTADIALKTDDKETAYKNFESAGKMNFDANIKNISLLNHAKLAIELYNNTAPVYAYYKAHPKENIKRELALAYYVDKRYEDAISTLLSLVRLTERDNADVQKIAFLQGMDFFDSTAFDDAIKSFDFSLEYAKYDPYFAAQARYWKAESFYKKKEYQNAQKQYENFIHSAGAFNRNREFQLAHYNIGYCNFKQNHYDNAITWFRKFINLSAKDTLYLGDAYNRIGDCYFMQQKYNLASENYEQTIKFKATHFDYAMFQRGMALGLINKPQEKLKTLGQISEFYPQSPYAPAAIYEMGRTYLQSNRFEMAGKAFTTITEYYKKSYYYQLALIELGLLNVNTGNYNKAIEYYKSAITYDPQSQEAKNALVGLKNAYLETGEIESYFAFVDQLAPSGIDDNEKEKEEGRFTVAERLYLANDCDGAIKAFKQFLQNYPNSEYLIQANFYLGDCLYKESMFEKAKENFTYVINQPKNTFTELSMLGLARIASKQEDYSEIIKAYERLFLATQEQEYKLEAMRRIMQANYNLNNYQQAIDTADRLLLFPDVSEKDIIEAQLIRAKSTYQLGNHEKAIQYFKQLATSYPKTSEGAEASYSIIYILHQDNRDEEAIKAIFDFTAQSNQQYWTAQCFIILGDIYVTRDEINQAKATYQSLIDNYRIQGDGIIDAVKQRLAAIQ
jgi:tetratricopeptide (TPR) repeat protein